MNPEKTCQCAAACECECTCGAWSDETPLPATPLPWKLEIDSSEWAIVTEELLPHVEPIIACGDDADWHLLAKNMAYLVHAGNTFPALEAEVARLRKALALVRFHCVNHGFPEDGTTCGIIDAALKGVPDGG